MFKKYLTADNSYAQLDGNVNTTQVQILLKNGQNVPTAGNWIGTLVQYGQDGYPSKYEKVYVSAIAGSLITVTRAYDGSTAQTFNDGDYIFLNVTSEVIKDLQNEVARIATDAQFKSEKNQANGYAGLDSNGKLDPAQIPALKSHEFLTVTNAAARYALTTSQVQVGDEVLETSTGETYVLIAADPSQAGSWLFKSDTTPSWSAIGGKPTTIAGYGITDAYTKTETDGKYVALTGDQTVAGIKTFTNGIVSGYLTTKDSVNWQTSAGVQKWHAYLYNANGDLNFAETGVADGRLYLKTGGNVGIGTTSPTQKLDVAGTVKSNAINIPVTGGSYIFDVNAGTQARIWASASSWLWVGAFSGGISFNNNTWVYTWDGYDTFTVQNSWGGAGTGTALKVHYAAATSDRYVAKFSSGWWDLLRIASDGIFNIDAKLRKNYLTWGSGSMLRMGSRYELSGITHGNQGHIFQFVWGDNADAEGTNNDGGWGLEFGPHGAPYLKMMANDTYIGKDYGYIYANAIRMKQSLYVGDGVFTGTANGAEARIGRGSDRGAGTITVQLGNSWGSTGQKFEIVDKAWTVVLFEVQNSGIVSAPYGVAVGNHSNTVAGITRWTGTKLQVYTGSAWVDLH